MLNSDALNQLSQLKQTIRAEKNLHPGTVRGSQARFGFVILDDGRRAFLPPNEMARVYPGDRVEVSVAQSEKSSDSNRIDAQLDKMLESPLKVVVGQYIVRGKGHFVAVNMPQLQRWVFIPPNGRSKAKPGDYIRCRLTRHPFEDGKGQAKVTSILGKPDDSRIVQRFIAEKYSLPGQWSDKELQQARRLGDMADADLWGTEAREDATALSFVTIDSESTLDMDDALFASTNEQGWELCVAIADPSCAIQLQTPLAKAAKSRGNSVYLPGQMIPMLPEALSQERFSLMPEQDRPALLCRMQVTRDGRITGHKFTFSRIRSRAKLSYQGVSEFLSSDNTTATMDGVDEETTASIRALADCTAALHRQRAENALLMADQDDYHFVVDANGKLQNIKRASKTPAHKIVEEAMLATNICAGEFFQSHPLSGVYSTHAGFRQDRLKQIEAVITSDFPALAEHDAATPDGYRALIQALQTIPEASSLLAALRLQLQPGVLSQEALPHFGLGIPCYANITSPLRRFNDFYNHLQLRALLNGDTPQPAPDLPELQQTISTARSASRDTELWLSLNYLQNLKGKPFEGRVSRTSPQGMQVQLLDFGVVGQVKANPKTAKQDDLRQRLTIDDRLYQIDDLVTVKISQVDSEKQQIHLQVVANQEAPTAETEQPEASAETAPNTQA